MTNPHPTLTPKEHEAFTLRQRGLSQNTIALAMNISRTRTRQLITNAQRKLQAKENAA